MEPPKSDPPKLPDMVMCGDHPSVTKTELNARDPQLDPNQKEPRELTLVPHGALGAAGALGAGRAIGALACTVGARVASDAPPRVLGGNVTARRRRARERRARASVTAALGSFRWPPYLVCVWVLALLVTHALHCVAALLQRSLPPLRKFCQYFRTWTEESWKTDTELNHRIYPMSLACVTGLLYTMYFGLNLIYCIALWSIEPLSSEIDEKQSISEIEPKVTNYMDEVNSKINFSIKQ
ncbi:uncharacterized protein ACR2FA_009016 [Aphomia sociella]